LGNAAECHDVLELGQAADFSHRRRSRRGGWVCTAAAPRVEQSDC